MVQKTQQAKVEEKDKSCEGKFPNTKDDVQVPKLRQ